MQKQIIVLGLLMGFASAAAAQAGKSSQKPMPASCSDTSIDWNTAVCFDAATPGFVGAHRFLRRDTVIVYLCQVPQDVSYRISVGQQPVAEPTFNPAGGNPDFALMDVVVGGKPLKVRPCSIGAILQAEPFTARTATLKLQNKSQTDTDFKDTPGVDPVTLQLGQPVFALSTGFAGTPLGKTAYQTLGGSGSSSTSTIGLQENSASRIQPMAFLSGSVAESRSWCCSMHITAGFTLTDNKLSTNPEFLFGPSVGMLNERLLITAGAYGGYKASLPNPYTVGGAAPSGAIPTLNQFHWKAGFAISWRITSLGGSSTQTGTTGKTTTTAAPKP